MSRTPGYSPDTFVIDGLREPLQERSRKVDTNVGVPGGVRPRVDRLGDLLRLNLLDVDEDAVASAEADDDFGHAEEEGLDPVLHELAVEGFHVAGVADLRARFELDPVDGGAFFVGFAVPDCVVFLV